MKKNMVNKKARILFLTWIVLTVIFAVLGIISNLISDYDNIGKLSDYLLLVPLILWLCYTLYLAGIAGYENFLARRINRKEPSERIAFWTKVQEHSNKYVIISRKWIIEISLGIAYLQDNNIAKAKELLANQDSAQDDWKNLIYYPLFLIAIYEDDAQNVNRYYNELLKVKAFKFDVQWAIAKPLFEMYQSGIYDESIAVKSQYPILKDICAKYQSNK